MSNQTKYIQNISLCRVARLQKIFKIFIAIEFKAKHSDNSLINLLKNYLLISNTGKKSIQWLINGWISIFLIFTRQNIFKMYLCAEWQDFKLLFKDDDGCRCRISFCRHAVCQNRHPPKNWTTWKQPSRKWNCFG